MNFRFALLPLLAVPVLASADGTMRTPEEVCAARADTQNAGRRLELTGDIFGYCPRISGGWCYKLQIGTNDFTVYENPESA